MDNKTEELKKKAEKIFNFFEPIPIGLAIRKAYFSTKRIQILLAYQNGFSGNWVYDSRTGKGINMVSYEEAMIARNMVEEHIRSTKKIIVVALPQ